MSTSRVLDNWHRCLKLTPNHQPLTSTYFLCRSLFKLEKATVTTAPAESRHWLKFRVWFVSESHALCMGTITVYSNPLFCGAWISVNRLLVSSSPTFNYPFTAHWKLYVGPSLTLKNFTFCTHKVFVAFLYDPQNKQQLSPIIFITRPEELNISKQFTLIFVFIVDLSRRLSGF